MSNKDEFGVRVYSSYEEVNSKCNYPVIKKIDLDRTTLNQKQVYTLQNYFNDLCLDFTIYCELFESKESVSTLNQFNSLIFSRFQRVYIEKFCLGISCLLDSVGSGSNKNLSLSRIVKQCNSVELDDKLQKIVDIFKSSGLKEWRRKLLAHNDLNTLMGSKVLELNFNKNDIRNILESIQEIFDDILNPSTFSDINVVLPRSQNGEEFIRKLQFSIDNDDMFQSN